jgi:hypothetical protein
VWLSAYRNQWWTFDDAVAESHARNAVKKDAVNFSDGMCAGRLLMIGGISHAGSPAV